MDKSSLFSELSDKEKKCIEIVRSIKLEKTLKSYSDLKKNGLKFYSILSEISSLSEIAEHYSWDKGFITVLKRFLVIPIAILLILLILVFIVPIEYAIHLKQLYDEKTNLVTHMRDLKNNSLWLDSPEYKDIESLWFLYGMKKFDYSPDERTDLLEKWLEILYGSTITTNLKIKNRIKKIQCRQSKAHSDYHEGRSNVHFHFVLPVDSLIRSLADELPLYE